MRRLRLALALLLGLVCLTSGLSAQGFGPQLPGAVQVNPPPDYDAWSRVAVRAERATEEGIASSFALERQRVELVAWRDRFLSAQTINAARIKTVKAQINALGSAPVEGQVEDPVITARRAELAATLGRLAAPAAFAAEAYAQANGLIGEIDRLIRERQAQRMTTRGPSPLNPVNWQDGLAELTNGVNLMMKESISLFQVGLKKGTLAAALPRIAILTLIGVLLLTRPRFWLSKIENFINQRKGRGAGVWTFILSFGMIFLPYAGLIAVTEAISTSGLLGFRGTTFARAIPDAGVFVIVGRWLASMYFSPLPDVAGPLDLRSDERKRGRWILSGLGWTLAIGTMAIALLSAGDASGVTAAVLLLPVEILIGFFLFHLGRLMLHHATAKASGQVLYREWLTGLLGRAAMLVAVGGPILAALGYSAATESLLYPGVTTLALFSVLVLLQRFVFDVFGMFTGAPEKSREALAPLLIGFAFFFMSLPLLALIWGARTADLAEVWNKFREGFSVGATRISPTVFMTFVLIFFVGYMITRLVQMTLRSSVLPKTKIDIGGQNAIVAGLGYFGIFLAAVTAISAAGIDLSSLAIVAGALSVGIGFGLQNIVSNFVSGIILLIERPISEGDWIEVGNQMGYVRDISVRSTRIETFDRTDVIVPNADLVSGQVTNWTRGNSVGRVIVPVGVAYGTDPDRVTQILREIAEAHPMVLMTPPPNIVFVSFGADSLNFEIRAILRDVNFVMNVRSDINHKIASRFAEEGIEIPFAQRDIWLRNPEVLYPSQKPRRGKPSKDDSA